MIVIMELKVCRTKWFMVLIWHFSKKLGKMMENIQLIPKINLRKKIISLATVCIITILTCLVIFTVTATGTTG